MTPTPWKIHFIPATVLNIEASQAFIALGDRAKDAVPALMKIYNERNSTETQSAVEVLGWIGPPAKPAIPLLLQAATKFKRESAGVCPCGCLRSSRPFIHNFLRHSLKLYKPLFEYVCRIL